MKIGLVEKAERLGLNNFDKWNDVTGIFPEESSYYYEAQSCVTDAVHIGIQMALLGKVRYNEDGDIDTSGYIEEKQPQPERSAEDVLFDTMTDNNFTYASFPAFIENESSVDVFDIAVKAMEQYRNQGMRILTDEEIEKWSKFHSEKYENDSTEKSVAYTACRRTAKWYRNKLTGK